jgi:hypothetical protein
MLFLYLYSILPFLSNIFNVVCHFFSLPCSGFYILSR